METEGFMKAWWLIEAKCDILAQHTSSSIFSFNPINKYIMCCHAYHKWRQNVVKTKQWHTKRSRVCHWCSYRDFNVFCDLLQTYGNMEPALHNKKAKYR